MQKKLHFTEDDYNCILQNKILTSPPGRLITFLQRMYPATNLNSIHQISIRYKRFDVVKTVDDVSIEIVNNRRFKGIIIDELEYFSL